MFEWIGQHAIVIILCVICLGVLVGQFYVEHTLLEDDPHEDIEDMRG